VNSVAEGKTSTEVNAAILYRQIRDTLTPAQFEQFAGYVTAFNNLSQSAEETLRKLNVLIKDRTLFLQMRTLILKALNESNLHSTTSASTKPNGVHSTIDKKSNSILSV